MSVFDGTAKTSYTLDLGVRMDSFFINAQQDTGAQLFWAIDAATDGEWSNFLASSSDRTKLRWSVLAFDTTGANSLVGGQRLFTTARQGDEAKIATMTNAQLSLGIGTTQAGVFIGAVNSTGTHTPFTTLTYDTTNGSSFNADPSNAYFGRAGVTGPTLNSNAPFNNSNLVGQSSWFYYLTRSGNPSGDKVLVDEFDNIAPGNAGDAYFGFIYVDAALYPDSPYVNKWLLSYTLLSATPTAAALQFGKTIGRTEISSGGYAVQLLPMAAAAAVPTGGIANVIETPASFASQLISDPLPIGVSLPVPEPGSAALGLAGLLALVLKHNGSQRRRRDETSEAAFRPLR
jgi:hypothetical protein